MKPPQAQRCRQIQLNPAQVVQTQPDPPQSAEVILNLLGWLRSASEVQTATDLPSWVATWSVGGHPDTEVGSDMVRLHRLDCF